MLKNLDGYLSACQLGITLASLGLGYVGHPIFTKLLGPIYELQINGEPILANEYWQQTISIAVGFTVITVLHIVVGEQAPKWLAIQRPLPPPRLPSGGAFFASKTDERCLIGGTHDAPGNARPPSAGKRPSRLWPFVRDMDECGVSSTSTLRWKGSTKVGSSSGMASRF